MQAVPQGANRYDRKRNDYAYDITYRIEVYGINDSKSDFFPSAQYRGTHKRYDYWFTGINTQILDYQQDFNYLYYIVQNANAPVRTRTTNWREVPRYFFQPRSEQSDQMNEGAVSEPSAQLADYLYSPGDTAKIKLKILGDPAWIQQGDVRGGLPQLGTLYDAFLPDGTINYAGQEILFEVLWNKPVDYDLTTGLMDPGTKNYNANRKAGLAGDAVQTYVYRATQCVSTFSRGQFTQELEGAQIYFEVPQAKQQAQQQRENVNQATASTTTTRPPSTTFLPNGLPVQTQGLATILDVGPAPSRSLPTDSLRASDYFPAPADAAEAPTSGSQIIGPAAASLSAIRTLGDASGAGVGAPETTLFLDDGQQVPITSPEEIQSYTAQTSSQARAAAANRLRIAQEAANNPLSTRLRQIIAKES